MLFMPDDPEEEPGVEAWDNDLLEGAVPFPEVPALNLTTANRSIV